MKGVEAAVEIDGETELRLAKKQVTLSNQSLIELGYVVRDFLELWQASECRPTFEEANCHQSVFYLLKRLITGADSEYLARHYGIRDFYKQDYDQAYDSLKPREEKQLMMRPGGSRGSARQEANRTRSGASRKRRTGSGQRRRGNSQERKQGYFSR